MSDKDEFEKEVKGTFEVDEPFAEAIKKAMHMPVYSSKRPLEASKAATLVSSSADSLAYATMPGFRRTVVHEPTSVAIDDLKGLEFMKVLDVKAMACDLLLDQSCKSIGIKPTIYNLFQLSFTKEGIHKLGFEKKDIEEVWKSIEKEKE